MMRLKLGKHKQLENKKMQKKPKLLRILLFSKKNKTKPTKKGKQEKLNPKLKLKLIELQTSSKKRKTLRQTKGKSTWRRKSLKTS